MNNHRLQLLKRIIGAGMLLAAATACSGGAGGAGSPGMLPAATGASGSGQTINSSISVFIPAPVTTSSSAKKRPLWLSSATAGLLISATSTATNQPTGQIAADISSGSPLCTSVTNGRSCVVTLAVPAGPQVFTFTTYDTVPVAGAFNSSPVGIGIVPQTIVANQPNVLNVTLGGIVASIQASLTSASVNFVPPAAPQLILKLLDPSGNAIVGGPYVDQHGNPVTVSLTATEDANHTISVPSGSVGAGSKILVKYSGLAASAFTSNISVSTSNGLSASLALNVLAPQFRAFAVNVYPQGIAGGSDNEVWFTTFNALGTSGGLGKVTTGGTVSYRGGPTGSMNVVAGPDTNLWVTQTNVAETTLSVDKIVPGSVATTYSVQGLPRGNAPMADPITVGPDDALWYADQGTNSIGRVTTTGVASDYPVSETPWNLVGGPNNAIWFTQCSGPRTSPDCSIGEMTLGGSVTSFPSAASPQPENMYSIVSGSDGNVWYTQGPSGQQALICMSGAGAICGNYALTGATMVQALTSNPDTAIWYGDQGSNTIGRVMLNGNIVSYPIPAAAGLSGNLYINAITTGPDGGLWWTEYDTHNDYAIGTVI